MTPHGQNLAIGAAGLVLSVLLAVAPLLVVVLVVGLVLGVLISPAVRRASAQLARYLGDDDGAR